MEDLVTIFWIIISLNLIDVHAQANISDACHGASREQTTNSLSCPAKTSICITDVFYYQWHINDLRCPHTINKRVISRCCRHDRDKCFWAASLADVTTLQAACDAKTSTNNSCDLNSPKPKAIRPICYVDNVVLSTVSSVRSIHYTCVQGPCSNIDGLTPEYLEVTPGKPKTSKKPTPPPKTTTTTGSPIQNSKAQNFTNKTSVNDSLGRENGDKGNGLSPLDDDGRTTLATAQIVAIDEQRNSDVGAILGGVFGGLIVCSILLGIFLLKRRIVWKGRDRVAPATTCSSIDQPYEEMGPSYANSSVAGSLGSFGSFNSCDSHIYSDIDSSGSVCNTRSFRESLTENNYQNVSDNSSYFVPTNRGGLRASQTAIDPDMKNWRTGRGTRGYDHLQIRGGKESVCQNPYDQISYGAVRSSRHAPVRSVSGHLARQAVRSAYARLDRPPSVAGTTYDSLHRDSTSACKDKEENQYNTLKPGWK